MVLKKCAGEVCEVRKKGRRGNKQLVMHLGEHAGNTARCNIPEMPNTTFRIVMLRVPICNNDQISSNPLQPSYTDVRDWEELIDFMEKNCYLQEPYCLTTIYKCNLTQDELDKEYIGFHAPRQMTNDPPYGQILFNSSLSSTFKLKLGYNVKLFLVEMKAVTRMDIAKHVMRLAKVIPASLITVSYAHG